MGDLKPGWLLALFVLGVWLCSQIHVRKELQQVKAERVEALEQALATRQHRVAVGVKGTSGPSCTKGRSRAGRRGVGDLERAPAQREASQRKASPVAPALLWHDRLYSAKVDVRFFPGGASMGTLHRFFAPIYVATMWTVCAFAAPELKVGDPAPPFVLQGSDGKSYTLAAYKGKQTVVIAWFAKAFTGG